MLEAQLCGERNIKMGMFCVCEQVRCKNQISTWSYAFSRVLRWKRATFLRVLIGSDSVV